ncbi:DUF4336 domain-containing protein [Bradyrhizobium sp.]|uniref:DUF4336 domain-containing protein n=1 Tax=Bradyrhizobium sp. TaxID=376 RepID=UPI003C679D2A
MTRSIAALFHTVPGGLGRVGQLKTEVPMVGLCAGFWKPAARARGRVHHAGVQKPAQQYRCRAKAHARSLVKPLARTERSPYDRGPWGCAIQTLSFPMPSTAQALYEPLNVPKLVAADLWVVDGSEIWFHFGVKVPFPTRMIIVRLPDGGLWLHSPVAPDPGLVARVKTLGPVRVLLAPNTLHYWWLADWAQLFPEAAVFAPLDLARTAKKTLPPHRALEDTPSPFWAGTIEQLIASGSIFTEIIFFHRPSRTLFLTDLIENFELSRVRSRWFRILLRMGGVVDPDGKAPIDMGLTFFGHRGELRNAVTKMLAWKPDRIILAHGRWYDRDGEHELKRAFRWVL